LVAFKVLPLGSNAPMPVPSPPFKTILELAFRAAVVLLLMSYQQNTFLTIFPLFSGTEKNHWGARSGE